MMATDGTFCMCIPAAGYVCRNCRKAKEDGDKLAEALQGYGYQRADQDGYDGEWCSPEEDKEEQFFAEAGAILGAEPVEA